MKRFLLGALCALSLPVAPAQGAPAMEVGLQDDAVLLTEAYYGRSAGLDRAQELGVTHLRVNVMWARVLAGQAQRTSKPAVVRYDFATHDALIDAAALRGIRVQLTLTGPAPRWAAGNRTVSNVRPNAREYGRFAAAAAKHFRGRVSRYAIWNEPNWHSWLSPARTAAAQYRALYVAGYAAVKATDPRAQVLFGELAPQYRKGQAIAPLRFARDVLGVDARYRLRAGRRGLRADGFAQHPYEFLHAPSFGRVPADSVTVGTLRRLTGALGRLRASRALRTPAGGLVPVYLTEFGYFASGPRKLTEAKRAAYTAQAFALARRNPHVRQMLYYQLVQNPAVGWNTGLLTKDGLPASPFAALASWAGREHAAGRLGRPRGPLAITPSRSHPDKP